VDQPGWGKHENISRRAKNRILSGRPFVFDTGIAFTASRSEKTEHGLFFNGWIDGGFFQGSNEGKY
jgi:hypothetical protein